MKQGRTDTTVLEAVAIVAICFGYFIVASTEAVVNDFPDFGFSDGDLLWIASYEVIAAIVALSVLQMRGYAIATLYPTPTLSGAATGVVVLVASVIAAQGLLLPFDRSFSEQPIARAITIGSPSLMSIVASAIVNGAFEEVFLLGFLLRGLRRYGIAIALGSSVLVRVLYHSYQGPLGAVFILGFGLVLSLYYLKSGQLFPVVFAHVLADIIPFL